MSLHNSIFIARTRGVGVLDGALALELGITGPNLRASGIDHDLRRDAPYGAYDELAVRTCVATEGDCLARAKVRIAEMRESIRLVRDGLDGDARGPHLRLQARSASRRR